MSREDDNGFGEWGGYFEAKKSKLEEQFAVASDPFRKTNLFQGISIFVNGRTDPSADELKRIMMVHGGTYHHYERPHTTFVIASNLPDVKVRNMNVSKFISASWVTECLQKDKLVDYTPFLLYTNRKTSQPRLEFRRAKKEDKTVEPATTNQLREPEQAATSPKQEVIPANTTLKAMNKEERTSAMSELDVQLKTALRELKQAVEGTSPELEDNVKLTEEQIRRNEVDAQLEVALKELKEAVEATSPEMEAKKSAPNGSDKDMSEEELEAEGSQREQLDPQLEEVLWELEQDIGEETSLNDKTDTDTEQQTEESQIGEMENPLAEALQELQQKDSKDSKNNSSHSAMTAVDPNFLSEFYKNSRLHHIATLATNFKQYIYELRKKHGSKGFPKRQDLKGLRKRNDVQENDGAIRYVMHIDMDCFFVSVGLRSHPELCGLPVAVTHSKGGRAATDVPVHPQADRQAEMELFAQRFEHHLHDNNKADKVRSGFDKKMSLSEVASCSYEARDKGIRNGMFVGQALKLCPELKTIPYDFKGYEEVAFTLYNTVAQYTLNIEAVSCDEMFVELTDMVAELQVDVMAFVGHLRQEVRRKTGCPCSAGVGPNKLLARLATKEAKPNGQRQLKFDENILAYMGPMPLETLPGVGNSLIYKMNQAGLLTCGDIQNIAVEQLEPLVGKTLAQGLHSRCRGIDPRPLNYDQKRKQVSAEINYGIRFTAPEQCDNFLRQLSIEVTRRLIEAKCRTKSINLKIMVRAPDAPVETSKFMGHGVCDVVNKTSPLRHPTDDVNVITAQVLKMMKIVNLPPNELRGIGIHLSKLVDASEVRKENILKEMFVKMVEKKKDSHTAQPVAPNPVAVEPKDKPKERPTVLGLLTAAADRKSVSEDKGRDEAAGGSRARTPQQKSPQPIATVGLDLEILAQLPEDIRHEVLSNLDEYMLMSDVCQVVTRRPPSPKFSPPPSPLADQPSTSRAATVRREKSSARNNHKTSVTADQIVSEYIENLPKHVDSALIDFINRPPDEVPSQLPHNILVQYDFKRLLYDWVTREEVPSQTDVEMLHSQIIELVKDDHTSLIYEVMKYLCRIINSKRNNSCEWHLTYNHMEADIQRKMVEVHGYNIHFTESIHCNKCIY
ncbi:hypothetical protein KR018_005623 [Drosophila ironensis]|nr:hypothetical protein KR018_005623 [Drosophila ironensis]